jgi:dethiobiotin synthetase
VLRGLFITGTDTDVGKTVVAAAVMHRCRHLGNLRYWKPIQTGIEQDDDTATVKRLGTCRESEIFAQGIRLPRPLSPHFAARLAGVQINIQDLRALMDTHTGPDRWIVEGAGGIMVPINETDFMLDFMALLGLPVLVAARSTLGTINHTLLTLQALRSRDLQVAGVVMIGEKNRDNRHAIERYGFVDVLGEMPRFPTLSADVIRHWASSELDPANSLSKSLQ